MHVTDSGTTPSPNKPSIFSSASALDKVPAARPASSSSAGPDVMLAELVLLFTLPPGPAAPLLATEALVAAAGGLPAGALVFLMPRALGPASAVPCAAKIPGQHEDVELAHRQSSSFSTDVQFASMTLVQWPLAVSFDAPAGSDDDHQQPQQGWLCTVVCGKLLMAGYKDAVLMQILLTHINKHTGYLL